MPIDSTPDDASALTPLTTTTTTTPPLQSPCTSCDQMRAMSGQPQGGSTDATGGPFRYGNGEIQLSETDLSFDGLGFNWAHTRSYDNILSYVYVGPAGNCWFVNQMPFLQLGSGTPASTITVVSDPTSRLAYTRDGATNNYLPKFFQQDTMVYDSTNHQYIFTRTDGQKQIFNSSGKLQRVVSPGGQIMTATYSGSNMASLLTIYGGSSTGFIYSYVSGTQRLSGVVLQINGVAQRRALYTYYGSGDPNGMSGDLSTVEIQQWNGTAWPSIKTSYYRYYTTNTAPGIQHGLK